MHKDLVTYGPQLRFVAAGATNTALTYGLYLVLSQGLSYLAAYSAAYATGIVFSYFFNSVLVFHERPTVRKLLVFPSVYLLQYALSSALLWTLVEQGRVPHALALGLVQALVLPITFLATRRFIIGRTSPEDLAPLTEQFTPEGVR